MKNRAVLTALILLSVVFVFTALAPAQSVSDMRRDLVVSQLSSMGHGEFGAVNGKVKNNSANHYACVRLDFDLSTRYDMRQAGQPDRHLGVLSVEVKDIQPHSERPFFKSLPFPSAVGPRPVRECTGQITEPTVREPMVVPNPNEQKVILYENPNFRGNEKPYGIGTHSLVDFDNMASSIKVPSASVVIVYEHSGEGVGYGKYVDFLEDQPNLANYNFDNQISHLKIVPRRSSGSVWVRNSLQNGQFEGGHYQVVGRRGGTPPANPNPLVGPPIRPPGRTQPQPRPPVFCTLTGQVKHYGSIYASTFTLFLYRSDGSRTHSTKITGGQYTIPNVPEGTYELRGVGHYQPTNQIIRRRLASA